MHKTFIQLRTYKPCCQPIWLVCPLWMHTAVTECSSLPLHVSSVSIHYRSYQTPLLQHPFFHRNSSNDVIIISFTLCMIIIFSNSLKWQSLFVRWIICINTYSWYTAETFLTSSIPYGQFNIHSFSSMTEVAILSCTASLNTQLRKTTPILYITYKMNTWWEFE